MRWLLAFLALLAAAPLHAQDERPLAITYDPTASFRPVVRVGPVLRDRELEQTARSGVPVRMRIRVELWKDQIFDALVDSATTSSIIVFEPIGELYLVRTLPANNQTRRFTSFAEVRAGIETEYLPRIRPRSAGRHYYTVTLQIETLSVSDLDELERWVQGELQPAVSGERSVPGAIGQGAKRLMLRLLDLPTRRYDARTERFRVP
jgi:hypothetical protein